MASFSRYEDIVAWQHARVLVRWIYEMSRGEMFAKDFGLKTQMQRAGVSIMSNIAEGFGRNSSKEFVQFLNIAKGSAAEVSAQLYVALDNGYIRKNSLKRCIN